ncbi:MAG TPA: hypothetical protein VEI02_06630, partial [Planctomycetota bacterium]|nr:hypothetical protein [Planctomycetota bacterium]
MIELRSGVIVAVVAATAFAQTGAEPSEAFDLRTHVRRDDACRVTLNRVVGGKLKIEGAKPPIVDFDEKTDESWVDHRSHDSGAQQYDDRRVILDARTTRLGRIADSGDAGMTLLWAMRAGTPGLYPDRNVLGRKDRLLTQRDFAHLRLALPSEARIGDAFDVDPIALVATTASLRGASREATLRLTAKSRNAKTGLVRLEGPLTFFEDLAVGGGATTLKHVLGVAVDFDPARGAAASITLKGKATPVAASGGKVTATGELSIATSLTSQRMPDAATWKPPAPTF